MSIFHHLVPLLHPEIEVLSMTIDDTNDGEL